MGIYPGWHGLFFSIHNEGLEGDLIIKHRGSFLMAAVKMAVC